MREGMSAAGSKVGTRSPDAGAALDLMESPCPRSADAHEKILCGAEAGVLRVQEMGGDGRSSTRSGSAPALRWSPGSSR